MAVLLSRRRLAPKPYDTSVVPPESQTRPQPPQGFLDIGTTTDGLDTATKVLEKRILGVFKTVINPPTIPPLFHKIRRLHQLQVSARVGLTDLERVDQLAHPKTFFDRQQARRSRRRSLSASKRSLVLCLPKSPYALKSLHYSKPVTLLPDEILGLVMARGRCMILVIRHRHVHAVR